MCNHVRDTLSHYFEIRFSRTKKEICGTFFFYWNIWGKTETYLVSFCLNSFRDLTLQITFNSRDGSTLNKILSIINADNLYTSERKIKRARRIISRNLTSWQENEKLWCVLKFLESWIIVTSIFQERNGGRVNVFSCPCLKLKNSMLYTDKKILTATSLKSKWHWTEDFVVVNREWWVVKSK